MTKLANPQLPDVFLAETAGSLPGRVPLVVPAAPDAGGDVEAIERVGKALRVHLDGTQDTVSVRGNTKLVTASFARPGDTTPYAAGDLVANNTTAGSVTPMQFAVAREAGGSGMIRRARLRKSGTGVSGANFRLHLYRLAPTCQNGDNGAWLTNRAMDYLGAFDITCDRVFTDGAAGSGVPLTGSEINFDLPDGVSIVFGLLEARGAYTPATAEQFNVELEVLQN